MKDEELSITIREYIEEYLKIKTKDGQLVNLSMNYAQNRLYDIFRDAYNEDRPCKIIVLKARQLGISTVTEAIISSLVMTTYYVSALIVAHISDASQNIYNMSKRYYDELPPALKPMIKYSNARELVFQNPDDKAAEDNKGLRSSIRVATAGQSGVGRSQTFNYMHLSEVAFWKEEDGKTVQSQLTGLLQTLPQHGFSFLVIESTANGWNYFKSLWDKAVAGENDYVPLFIPWFEMEDYRLPYHGEKLSPEETELCSKYEIDEEQIMWRRYAIANLCGGDIDQFRQEYPSTPEEAFIMTGSPVFNTDKVLQRMSEVQPADSTGMFTDSGTYYEDSRGYISIWKMPEPNHVYVIGADTAGEGSDYFNAYVIDKNTGVQVARYRAQSDEGLFVKQIYYLGYFYNIAMIAPEVNFSSYPTAKLQEMNYPNMYVREQVDTYKYKTQSSFGFRTTSRTRPLIIDNLVDLVREEAEKINDIEFLRECLSFVKNPNTGKPEATEGTHDDCVMSMAIAYFVLPQAQQVYVDTTEAEKDEYSDDISSFLGYGE
jgi:hypothetical protein